VKIRHEGRFVVVGIDVREGHSASLLLAARAGRKLTYIGRVEWGVRRANVEEIVVRDGKWASAACDGLECQCGVVWVDPRIVVEVMLGRLRDPVLRRLVPDSRKA
jgi:ATP-dependent DNA ligase